MKYIVRAFADGTDFVGTEKFRPVGVKADRRGLGDMICEVSNLYHMTDGGDVLVPFDIPSRKEFVSMIDRDNSRYTWTVDPSKFQALVNMCGNNYMLEMLSSRTLVMCYTSNYIQLDHSKFEPTEIPDGDFVTIQSTPKAQKCEYTPQHIEAIKRLYPNENIIEVGGREDLGLKKVAYIISKAKFHIGIDSGLTHLAYTIKHPSDVHVHLPEDRITGAARKWVENGNVFLFRR